MRLKSFYANQVWETLWDFKNKNLFYEKNDFIYCAGCKNGAGKSDNKILENKHKKTTLLPNMRVLNNICFMKFFEFVYEKDEKQPIS